ncbi:MAG TPA: hypothetical protein VHM70_29250 [Polyangiaceae bacterium]|nr:hypothetical protein [Polyangiaceae bacterium]
MDFAGEGDPFATKVAAAELQLVVMRCAAAPRICVGPLQKLTVRAGNATLVAVPLGPDYTLIVHLPRGRFQTSQRALSQAVRALCAEGELPVPNTFARDEWVQVRVRDDRSRSRRPAAVWIFDEWTPLHVFGRVRGADLAKNEVAYRVQLVSGQEATLVREPLGRWFSDKPLVG